MKDGGHFMMLPLSSTHLFVACTRSTLRFSKQRKITMTPQDVEYLCALAIVKAHTWVFSAEPFDESLIKSIRSRHARSPALESEMSLREWHGNHHPTTPNVDDFSFLMDVGP